MSFLTLNSLSKTYGNFTAVDAVSLEVGKGEFVSLLGPSGCGKTTTLQMIAGLVEPSAGSVMLDGRDITHEKPNRRGLGIVFQTYALFPHMTVAQNVSFGLEMRRIGKAERDRRVAEVLALVKLDRFFDRYPRQLSGGQRQRVAIARALVIEPPVLLLDEPLSNLDAKLREEMQFELRRIQQTVGTTTIMVTHDQGEALSISDRVVVMEHGRMTQVDVPAAVYDHPATEFISSFIGKMNNISGTALTSAIQSSGVILPATGSGAAEGEPVILSLRPERINIVPAGEGHLPGVVSARFFFGSHWLFNVETAVGLIIVSSPNTDRSLPPAVGQPVELAWAPESARMAARPQEVSRVEG
ncbi:ABC transporter ATP-binding protein [Rhizobium sp. SL86]|uniref:ABC transporter ATP-binding protein n=1 Tax=Rhizobium sp. SL86 TaxID=2995148 RepID=UPI00227312C2|nr:ABC transporter ATP-binding protein [Rhizobium sp. SL86]MCY1666353.1 ABC transporter ATP-binding protein [Rhizobium sp. SL86]